MIIKDGILKMLFNIDLINIYKNEDGSISIHFFGDDKHRDIQLDPDCNEMIGSGCFVDSNTLAAVRAKAEREYQSEYERSDYASI